MMEDRREVGRPRRDEQTECIRISLASVKTSDGASLEIFLVVASGRRRTIHRAADVSQLTESSKVIDRRTGRTQGGCARSKVRDIKFT